MHRFFVPPKDLAETEISLTGEVLHHLAVVLRLTVGDEILLLDGLGTLCRCRITTLKKKNGQATVLERWQETDTAFPIHLLQALPKGDKMDLILQKGTELGVGRFSPLFSRRSVPKLAPDRAEQRSQRWQRIVCEAARQSRRPLLPSVTAPRPLGDALAECGEELRLMLWEEGSRPLAEALPAKVPDSLALLVGPEGGFTAEEAQQAAQIGFQPVHLGPRIMRSETAGFAVTAILQYHYGDLGPAAT
jgi:16S rRNA (uracil1498-N3)-methyltransferase